MGRPISGFDKAMYNLNPVNLLKGKSKGCGRNHDTYTVAEKAADKVGGFVSDVAKGMGSIFDSQPKSHHVKRDPRISGGPIKPDSPTIDPKTFPDPEPNVDQKTTPDPVPTETPKPSEPPVKEEPKPTTPPTTPPTQQGPTEELETYKNTANSHEGFSFVKTPNGEAKMSVEKIKMPEAATNAAFNLMSNDDTSIELKNKNFGQMFKDYHASNEKGSKDTPISEEQFVQFHKAYTNNANAQVDKERIQNKANTVDMKPADEAHIKNLFKTMAGKDNSLTKQEFTNFNTKMFGQFASGQNGQDNKLTRAEQEQFIKDWKAE